MAYGPSAVDLPEVIPAVCSAEPRRLIGTTSRGVPTTMLLQNGEVADLIAATAREEGADVIAVGTHGQGPVGLTRAARR